MSSPGKMEDYDRLQKENAELRTKLSGQTCFVPPEFQRELDETKRQLAAANKRIEEAEKQEPVAYVYPAAFGSRASLSKNNKPADWDDSEVTWYETPLYAKPIPPADAEALQGHVSILQKQREEDSALNPETK